MAGAITTALVDELQIRMENPEADKFTDAMCLDALNHAQKKTAIMMHNDYLGELQVITTAGSASSSTKAFPSGAGNLPLNGAEGILEVYSVTNSKFMKKTRVEDQKRFENTLLAGGSTNLIYYLWDQQIYITTGLATESMQEYFLKTPVEMTTSVDPVLGTRLHEIMLRFAEGNLWTTDKKLGRRVSAYKDALEQIKRMNKKAFDAEPEGIGTKESRRQEDNTIRR